jgi:4-amino-4-deoxy-L-arabinose transferase-like glycosyltransferase
VPGIANKNTGSALLVAGLLLLSAICACWSLSARPLDDHECYVTVTSREMLESSNWIMPTFNGQSRLQKTPLSYWLVSILAKITGRVDEFAARLPSAVFAVLSVCVVLYFVSRWLSPRTALVCAGVWATSLGYVNYSHNARPEMVLTFLVTLCFLSFYTALTTQDRKKQIAYMVVFWVSFGLGNLAKGPAPLPLVGIPLLIYITIFRQWRQVPKLLPVAGVIILLAIMLPWPIIAAYKVHWVIAIWKREFIDRFLGEYATGHYPIYYYFLIMFKYATPWVAFLPMALAAPFYRVWDKKQPLMYFMWIWFVADFAFLTISGGKRQHYALPLMPAMMILTGILLDDMVFTREVFSPRFAKTVLLGHIAAAPVVAIVTVLVMLSFSRGLLPLAILGTVIIVVPAFAVALLFAKRRYSAGFAAILVWSAGVMLVCDVEYRNRNSPYEPTKRFALTVAEKVPASDKLAASGTVLPSFIHYFGRVVPENSGRAEIYDFYQQGLWIVAFGKELERLQKDGRFELVYLSKDAARHRKDIIPAGLFHKTGSIPRLSS